ncbi:DUF397 domain-containing protein [Actinomadura adrarensis]|uniref:DUF397 domain-containing protein n=1 Tax=Actinomadura adrarensis TaxID=1819600 RepID=A0ABW3CTP0_9ACTN
MARFPGVVGVRDSKAAEDGHIAVSAGEFAEIVDRIKAGELDL